MLYIWKVVQSKNCCSSSWYTYEHQHPVRPKCWGVNGLWLKLRSWDIALKLAWRSSTSLTHIWQVYCAAVWQYKFVACYATVAREWSQNFSMIVLSCSQHIWHIGWQLVNVSAAADKSSCHHVTTLAFIARICESLDKFLSGVTLTWKLLKSRAACCRLC